MYGATRLRALNSRLPAPRGGEARIFACKRYHVIPPVSRLCQIPGRRLEAIPEMDGELPFRRAPIGWRGFPATGHLPQGEINQLLGSLLAREMPPGFHRPPNAAVQALDRVRRVDRLPKRRREAKAGDHPRPVPAPAFHHVRIALAEFARGESLQRRLRGFRIGSLVDLLQFLRQLSAFLPGSAGQEYRSRCTMQVCTTVSGKAVSSASGKPFRPSTTATRMSSTPRFFS